MRGPGILWMLQTVTGMSMAGPMFFLGANYLLAGRYVWGIGFLLFGGLVLYFPTYLVDRIGGPRTWIRRRIGRGDGTDADRETADESASGPLIDRLRRR